MGFVYRVFLKGLLALLPFLITLYLLTWVAEGAESVFGGPLKSMSLYFPGAGVAVLTLVIFFVGLLINNYLTKGFFGWLEAQVDKTPIIRSIYSPIRDLTKIFTHSEGSSNQRVVMVDFGDTGIQAMGLITRDNFDDLPLGMVQPGRVAVFLPYSYGVGGFTVIVPRSSVHETSMPAERALQLAITGWIKTPTEKL